MSVSGAEAPTRIALDTSAYSRLRAGDERVAEMVAAAELVYVPAIVLGELEGGFRLGRRAEENRASLRQFLAEPWARVLPVSEDVARHYGRLFAEQRRAGAPVPINDLWIAACAAEAGAHLVTFDSDFEKIPGLDRTLLRPPERDGER